MHYGGARGRLQESPAGSAPAPDSDGPGALSGRGAGIPWAHH
jgi:hypothetical protein